MLLVFLPFPLQLCMMAAPSHSMQAFGGPRPGLDALLPWTVPRVPWVRTYKYYNMPIIIII